MDEGTAELRRRQALTVGLMVLGYSGYYLCRSNFSVTLPLIADDLEASGLDPGVAKVRLGAIASAGILAYALGKPFAGGLADFLGGRGNFLIGMAGAIILTFAFASGGTLPVFLIAWVGNRLSQSLGWAGMIKITSRWFSSSTYGTVMGILSLSYLFGDAAARYFMGLLIARGFSWRGVFSVAAWILFGIFLLCAWLLKETPAQLGLREPRADPENLYGEGGDEPTPPSLGALLGPLLRSPALWLICLLSLGVTLLRETFNTWTPTYFVDGVGLSRAEAAGTSALFPLFGGVSVLLAGYLSDRLGRGGRAVIIVVGLTLAGAALAGLGLADFGGSTRWPVVLVTAVAFLLLGPYSYLAGAMALDFGGKRGGATASGLIDFVGYLGGVLAGEGMARAVLALGWRGAFLVLAGIAWLSSVVAGVFLVEQRRGAGPS
jgi:sugar phosphate permease